MAAWLPGYGGARMAMPITSTGGPPGRPPRRVPRSGSPPPGDIHFGRRADDRERAAAAFGALRRPRRRRPARRRPDHARRARAGRDRRRRRARRSRRPRARPCSATTTGTSTARDEFARRAARRAGIDVLEREPPRSSRSAAPSSASPARRASWAASPARTSRTSASRCCARSTPSRSREAAGARRGPARDRAVPVPDRAAALRADRRRRWRASGRDIWTFLGTDRLAAADPRARSRPGPARPRPRRHVRGPRSARCRSTTSRCPVLGEDFWVFELTGAARAPSEVH